VIDEPQLPRAAQTFISFVALLRANGFPVAPEQTTAFLAAIELLGPRSPEDIRQAGLATLAPPPERRAAYDMLFRIHFLGGEEIPGAEGEDEREDPDRDEGVEVLVPGEGKEHASEQERRDDAEHRHDGGNPRSMVQKQAARPGHISVRCARQHERSEQDRFGTGWRSRFGLFSG